MRAQKALPESEENAAVRGISFLPAYLKYPQTAQVSSAVDTVVSLYSPCLVLSLQLLSCLPRVLFCSNYDAQCSIEDKLICLERAYEGANSAYCLRITEARILYNGCHQSLAVGLAHLHAHTHISTHTHTSTYRHIFPAFCRDAEAAVEALARAALTDRASWVHAVRQPLQVPINFIPALNCCNYKWNIYLLVGAVDYQAPAFLRLHAIRFIKDSQNFEYRKGGLIEKRPLKCLMNCCAARAQVQVPLFWHSLEVAPNQCTDTQLAQ
jgi:hypothetical protein